MSNIDDKKKIGLKIKENREYRGFSQEQIAKLLGIPRSAISLIETGSRSVDAVELTKLSRLFNCSMEELLGKEPDKVSISFATRMVKMTSDLSDDDKNEVMRFAQFLKNRKEKNK